jgi:hypothetical protein
LVEETVNTDLRIYGGVYGPQTDIIEGHEQDERDGSNHRLRMEVVDTTTGRSKTFWIHMLSQARWEIRQTGKPDPVVYVDAWEQGTVVVGFMYDAYWDWIETSGAAALMVDDSVASRSPVAPVQSVLEDPPLILEVMIRNDTSGWVPLFIPETIRVDSTTDKFWRTSPFASIPRTDILLAAGPTDVKIVVSGGYNPYTREYLLEKIRNKGELVPVWWVYGELEGKRLYPINLSALETAPTVSVGYRSFILWENSAAANTRLVRPLPSTTRSATRPRRLRVPTGGGGRGGSPE